VLANVSFVFTDSSQKNYMKKDHSLIKPYADDHWEFIGSTIVTNNYVRLTADVRSAQGAIWNTAPCKLRDWELHVHFKVHGSARDLFGDGLAIWYTKHRLELGPVYGSRDYFMGLGVFLDTYANQDGGQHSNTHPYISAMVNNGSLHYDHDLDGKMTALSGCQANLRGAKHETYIAIRYEHDKLTVSTDMEGKNQWKLCFSVDSVRLPTDYYFGVSATTGDLSDNHDLISMKLYDIGVERKEEVGVDYTKIEPGADIDPALRDRADDVKGSVRGMSSWKVYLFAFLGVVAIGVGALVAYIVYTKLRSNSRQRFY
jgi:mannose-binding lectin 2